MIDGQKRGFMQFQDVRAFLDSILDEDIHTKRVDSLANATLGVMTGASLGVAIIGKSWVGRPNRAESYGKEPDFQPNFSFSLRTPMD